MLSLANLVEGQDGDDPLAQLGPVLRRDNVVLYQRVITGPAGLVHQLDVAVLGVLKNLGMQLDGVFAYMFLVSYEGDSQSLPEEPVKGSLHDLVHSQIGVLRKVPRETEVALGATGIGVDADDGLLIVKNLRGSHQERSVTT